MSTLIALPPKQQTNATWYGPALSADPAKWTHNLTPSQIAELNQALVHTLNINGSDIAAITPDSFPLPILEADLATIADRLINGCGCTLIKGLPIGDYSQLEAAALFYGIGSHLGHARSQNAAGHILGHVRDLGKAGDDPTARIYQTKERQTFHTDSTDVVALLCLKQAESGGESLLVSAETIYNEFLARRPDQLPRLFDPIATDRRGEVPEGQKPFFEIPVFSWFEGKLTAMYQRQYIMSAQRFDDVMRLTPDHIAAFDLFDELANDPALNTKMRLEPGDMQFVYNHALLHDRNGFEDWDEPEHKRHLFRLWLTMPNDRPLPYCFNERFGTTTIGDRGGIITEGTKLSAPIDV